MPIEDLKRRLRKLVYVNVTLKKYSITYLLCLKQTKLFLKNVKAINIKHL